MMNDPLVYFKALADETRLRLMNLLDHHELNVNEIVEIMQMGQSRISRHLKILTDSGLLSFRRDGLWAFYTATKSGQGQELLESIRFLLKGQPVFSDDLTRAEGIIEERSRHSIRFFNSIAGDWTRMKRDIIGDYDVIGEILRRIPGSGVIVDLGCGSGDLLAMIAREWTGSVIGVDRSVKMLEEARKSCERAGSNVDVRIGDLEHLPLGDGEADTAVLNMVLHHLRSPAACIRESYRVVRRGGTLVIAEFLAHGNEEMRKKYHDRWLGFMEEEIDSWLLNAGFAVMSRDIIAVKQGLDMCIYSAKKE